MDVLYRALATCALISCALVSLGFALFAVNQASSATRQQTAALNSAPSAPAPRQSRAEGQPRRFIDAAARKLTSPFRSLLSTSSQWSAEIFSTLMALLVYGVGLGYLARYSRLT